MEVLSGCRAFHNAELYGFILHGLFYFFRITAFQPYADIRITAAEQSQEGRQHVLGHRGTGPQAQFAGYGCIPGGCHVFVQRLVFLQNPAGMGQQAASFLRQDDAAPLPFKQPSVKQAFQFLHMEGDGRLGNEQFLRRAGKVEPPRNGFKNFQSEIRNHGRNDAIQPCRLGSGKLLSFIRFFLLKLMGVKNLL